MHTTVSDISAPLSSSTAAKEAIVQTQTTEWNQADGNSDHEVNTAISSKSSYRKQVGIEEIWTRVLNISRYTENNRKRMFNHFKIFNICTVYALHTIQCTLTDIYHPFLEDSRKTSVSSYSLLWSPECSIKFPVKSYTKCWISHFSSISEVLCSMWKQSVWECFFFLTKENRKEKKKKAKKELSLYTLQGWRADLSVWSVTNSQNSL